MTATIEKRRGELRADPGGRPRRLVGFAARYGVVANIGPFRERISPYAFAGSIGEGRADVLALLDHNPEKVLGRTKSGTLRLDDQAEGLAFEIDAPDTGAGRDALALAARGDLGGASIGFIVEDEARENDIRVIRRARLLEISIVSSWPAYPETSVEARQRLIAAAPAISRTPRRDRLGRYLETLGRG